jgi:formate dehydrogenase subunit gamma
MTTTTPYDVQPGDKVHHGDPVTVDRHTPFVRVNHWTAVISMILLWISGFALFHPSLFFLADLFGGGENTRAVHPWLGVILFLAFYGLFFRFWRACLFARGDGGWLVGMPALIAGGDEEKLPEVGRFNPGQKLFFWGMAIMLIVMLVSGLAIWDVYFFPYTTIDQKRIMVLVHSAVAVLAVCGVIIHVSMVIWERGTLRAMTRGYVTGGWAWKHHRKWLRELVTGGRVDA